MVETLFTHLKVQWPNDEQGANVTGEIHHQQNNQWNINCWSDTRGVCWWLVETHPRGTIETRKSSLSLYFWASCDVIGFFFKLLKWLHVCAMWVAECYVSWHFTVFDFQFKDDDVNANNVNFHKYFERFLLTLKTPSPCLIPLVQKSIEKTCAISKDYVYVYQRTLKNISFHVNMNENNVAKS